MKSKSILLTTALLFVFLIKARAQNIAITDDDTYVAKSSAILDIKSDTKGLLFPRLTTAQRTTLASSAVAGLMVYDTDLNGFYFYNGTMWLPLYTNLSGVSVNETSSLFAVLNAVGDTVFAVFPEGVRINVGNGSTSKGNRGGFAVGGLSSGGKLGEPANYLTIADSSIRMYVGDPYSKGNRGGFAVGGLSSGGKVNPINFMDITPQNYFIGHESGLLSTGINNTFLGYQSGKDNTSGYSNVFLGYQSGMSNTSGDRNIFIGYKSGINNTTGFGNILIGQEVADSNETGFRNIMIGYRSGFLGKSSQDNMFIGNTSGYNISTGRYNVFVGDGSGYTNTTGSENTLVGYSAGNTNSTGWGNTFIGKSSGRSSISGYNTFVGASSGYNNTTYRNTFVGYSSGYSNTTGAENVFMGYFTGLSHNTGHNNVFVGSQAGRYDQTGANNVFVGFKAGHDNIKGTQNVLIGSMAGVSDTLGNYNVMIGYQAGYKDTTGSGNVFIGYQAGYNEQNSNKLYIENSQSSTPLIYGDFLTEEVEINGSLEVSSTSGGFVVPRMTTTQRDALSPVNGMIIYNTTDNVFNFYEAGSWVTK